MTIYDLNFQNSDGGGIPQKQFSPLSGSSLNFNTRMFNTSMPPANYGFNGMVGAGQGGLGFGPQTNTPNSFVSVGNAPGGSGLGFNIGTAGLAFNGLSALTNLYTGLQGVKLAKKQFEFGRKSALRNERNSINDYNAKTRDRLNARAEFGQSAPGTAEAEYERRKAV